MTEPTYAPTVKAIALILDAVVETVRECGADGAPGGFLYAALMGHGCALETFESMMAALVAAGRLRKSGHVYYAADA